MITITCFWLLCGLVGLMFMRLQLKLKGDWTNRKLAFGIMLGLVLGPMFMFMQSSEVQDELTFRRNKR